MNEMYQPLRQDAPLPIEPHVTEDTAVVTRVGRESVSVKLLRSRARGVIWHSQLVHDIAEQPVEVGDAFEVVIHGYRKAHEYWCVSPREYEARAALKRLGLSRGDIVQAQVVAVRANEADLRIGDMPAILSKEEVAQPWSAFEILALLGKLVPGQHVPVCLSKWDLDAQMLRVTHARPPRYLKRVMPGEATVVLVRTNHLSSGRLVHYVYGECPDGSLVRLRIKHLQDPLAYFPVGSTLPFVTGAWDSDLGMSQVKVDWTAHLPPAAPVELGREEDFVVLLPATHGCFGIIHDGVTCFMPDVLGYKGGDRLRVRITQVSDVFAIPHQAEFVAFLGFKPEHRVHGAVGVLPSAVPGEER